MFPKNCNSGSRYDIATFFRKLKLTKFSIVLDKQELPEKQVQGIPNRLQTMVELSKAVTPPYEL